MVIIGYIIYFSAQHPFYGEIPNFKGSSKEWPLHECDEKFQRGGSYFEQIVTIKIGEKK